MVSISVGVIYYNITLTMIIVTDDSLTYPYELRHVGLYQLASVWQFVSFNFLSNVIHMRPIALVRCKLLHYILFIKIILSFLYIVISPLSNLTNL